MSKPIANTYDGSTEFPAARSRPITPAPISSSPPVSEPSPPRRFRGRGAAGNAGDGGGGGADGGPARAVVRRQLRGRVRTERVGGSGRGVGHVRRAGRILGRLGP